MVIFSIKPTKNKTNALANAFANNSSDNNFPTNFKDNKLNNIARCKIPLDSKFFNPDQLFNKPFTLNEFITAFIKRKSTAKRPR